MLGELLAVCESRARSSRQELGAAAAGELARKRNEELVGELQTDCLEERLVELLLVHSSH